MTHDITAYTTATRFAQVGKKSDMFVLCSTVADERGTADAERAIRGFAMKFYTEVDEQALFPGNQQRAGADLDRQGNCEGRERSATALVSIGGQQPQPGRKRRCQQ